LCAAAIAARDRQIIADFLDTDGTPYEACATVDREAQHANGGLNVTWEAGQRSGVRNSKEIVGPIGNPGLDLDSDDWRWAHPRADSAEQRRLEAIALAGLECRRTHAAERAARSHH
jgi:hypothetical protein